MDATHCSSRCNCPRSQGLRARKVLKGNRGLLDLWATQGRPDLQALQDRRASKASKVLPDRGVTWVLSGLPAPKVRQDHKVYVASRDLPDHKVRKACRVLTCQPARSFSCSRGLRLQSGTR